MPVIHQRTFVPSRLGLSPQQPADSVHKSWLASSTMAATKQAYIPWALLLVTLSSLLIYFGKIHTPCVSLEESTVLPAFSAVPDPLEFMRGRHLLLVSHDLSLSGGPLLLMELATMLTGVGAQVHWVTNHKDDGSDVVMISLEAKLRQQHVKILPARDPSAVHAAVAADLIVLNTAVAGKWLDVAFKDNLRHILPKVLWWIHEMRGHYFAPDLIKHLPAVAGAMIDSRATAEYWLNRTATELRLKMPRTYVVHLGNSRELTEAAESETGRRLLRAHVRERHGVHSNDVVYSMINSFSRGKGQDLFLLAFVEALQVINVHKQPRSGQIHAFLVGSDWAASSKYEAQLVEIARQHGVERFVHFVNKTLHVAPYLAASDVLVQNSQNRGECFGRITIEAMAFSLPVLGTAAGGTKEIVVDKSTGLLHPVGKGGVKPLAENIATLFFQNELRVQLGENGQNRARERFTEHHMSKRIARVFKEILSVNRQSSPLSTF